MGRRGLRHNVLRAFERTSNKSVYRPLLAMTFSAAMSSYVSLASHTIPLNIPYATVFSAVTTHSHFEPPPRLLVIKQYNHTPLRIARYQI